VDYALTEFARVTGSKFPESDFRMSDKHPQVYSLAFMQPKHAIRLA